MKLSKRLLTAVGAVLTSVSLSLASLGTLPAQAADPEVSYEITNLGAIPLMTVATYAQDFQQMDDGKPAAFVAVNGTPVTVAKVDPFTQEVEWQLELPGSSGGSWAVRAQPDGTVFAGTWSNGVLYRKLPNADSFEALGRPGPGVTWIWDIALDNEGGAFIGTFLNGSTDGRLYRWTEADGFRDYGAVVPGASNMQALAYHDGVVYVGSQPVNDVVAVNADTGDRESLPAPEGGFGRIMDLRVVNGVLWVHQAGASTVAFDLEAWEWLPVRVPGFGRGISNLGPDGRIYTDSHQYGIVAIDPVTFEWESIGSKPTGETFMMEWLRSETGEERLFGIQSTGVMLSYAVGDSGLTTQPLTHVTGDLAMPRALAEGPDGELWASSYMVYNYVPFDPDAEVWGEQLVATMGQGDAMASDDSHLWVGSYSGAIIWRLDPSAPLGPDNPLKIRQMSSEGQDRIHAITVTDDLVVAGSVPNYGLLGGALAVHEKGTGETDVYRNIVPDQSITSVVVHEDVIYAGSSVYGGLGVLPTQDDGVVIAVDPSTGEVLESWTPVPGQRAIRQLAVGPDGDLWGLAGGELFKIDLVTGESSLVASIAPVNWESLDHQWEHGYLAVNPVTGHLTGIAGISADSKVFTFDPETEELNILDSDVSHPFFQHSNGDMYWVDSGDLLRARPVVPEPEPTPEADPGALLEELKLELETAGISGPIAKQLANSLEQARHHWAAGRTESATRALERFVAHLGKPKKPDVIGADVAEALSADALALMEAMEIE